ncbi:hypothetical protein LRC484719_32900 [Mycobacterium riyadhense]
MAAEVSDDVILTGEPIAAAKAVTGDMGLKRYIAAASCAYISPYSASRAVIAGMS